RRALQQAGVASIEDVRARSEPLIRFSDQIQHENEALKRFLREQLYHHHQVYRIMVKAQRVVRELFTALLADPRLMPPDFFDAARQLEAREGESGRARVVADYVAGMTDRFALDEYERLFDPRRLR